MGSLIVMGIILVVGLGWYMALRRQAEQLPAGARSAVPAVVLALALGVPAAMLAFSVCWVIPAGHVGVKVLFGQVDAAPLREGLRLVWNPLYDIVMVDTRVSKHTAKSNATSKDLQPVHMEMVINYRVIPERAPEVYRTIGIAYSSVIIDPAGQEVLKADMALNNAAEILPNRAAIKADVQHNLAVWLAKYGIELKEAALVDIRFEPAYEKAVEAKQIEEQKAEQKRYELVQAQRTAEIMAAQAKGKGDAAREEAIGVADALRIRGEAENTYNSTVVASLTPVLIQQQYLARWDGRLPQYTLGGNVAPQLQLPLPGLPGDVAQR